MNREKIYTHKNALRHTDFIEKIITMDGQDKQVDFIDCTRINRPFRNVKANIYLMPRFLQCSMHNSTAWEKKKVSCSQH